MMRIFLDTEFTGLHQHTTLISIGLAAENGAMFYAELSDYDRDQVDSWVRTNVLPLLSGSLSNAEFAHTKPVMLCQGSIVDVSRAFHRWMRQFEGKNSVVIWADVLAWDWVLFCDLCGGTFALPEQVHYIPRDLSTLIEIKGLDPDIPREQLGAVDWKHPKLKLAKHHALYDALLEKSVFENTQLL